MSKLSEVWPAVFSYGISCWWSKSQKFPPGGWGEKIAVIFRTLFPQNHKVAGLIPFFFHVAIQHANLQGFPGKGHRVLLLCDFSHWISVSESFTLRLCKEGWWKGDNGKTWRISFFNFSIICKFWGLELKVVCEHFVASASTNVMRHAYCPPVLIMSWETQR
jgi:hypothetical protein